MRHAPRTVLFSMLAVSLPAGYLLCPRQASGELPAAVIEAEGWPDFRVHQQVRDEIALDAAAGRRTLVECAALFGELNDIPPRMTAPYHDDPENPPLSIPFDTAESRLCRQVVIRAYWTLRQKADDQTADAALTRLAKAYGEEARRPGGVRLPNPATLDPIGKLLSRSRMGRTSP